MMLWLSVGFLLDRGKAAGKQQDCNLNNGGGKLAGETNAIPNVRSN